MKNSKDTLVRSKGNIYKVKNDGEIFEITPSTASTHNGAKEWTIEDLRGAFNSPHYMTNVPDELIMDILEASYRDLPSNAMFKDFSPVDALQRNHILPPSINETIMTDSKKRYSAEYFIDAEKIIRNRGLNFSKCIGVDIADNTGAPMSLVSGAIDEDTLKILQKSDLSLSKCGKYMILGDSEKTNRPVHFDGVVIGESRIIDGRLVLQIKSEFADKLNKPSELTVRDSSKEIIVRHKDDISKAIRIPKGRRY